ncbi:MAG: permease-like cell division protein FtsX [Prevotella sp.]|jgi:cell division transport system permease protein|nr:permease-like cell division protein FtsX [Prevotella sp.]
MTKRKKRAGGRHGLQVVTLCISTALVLILLGLVVSLVLSAHNLSDRVRENLTVTMMLENDMTQTESQQLCARLRKRPYISHVTFISKQKALKEQAAAMGSDPTEFIGVNPFLPSIEMQLKSDYANTDSLKWISAELKKYSKVGDITYPRDLINQVNEMLSKISIVLLILAALLTFISFSLVNNTVRLGVYARRFSIHTMKLVGASWGFIRRPFVWQAVTIGIVAALIANGALAAGVYAWANYEPDVLSIITWQVMAITAVSVLIFGIVITAVCADLSVRKFLRMKAGDLYKI